MNSLNTNYYKFPPRVAISRWTKLNDDTQRIIELNRGMDRMDGWIYGVSECILSNECSVDINIEEEFSGYKRTPMGLRVYIKKRYAGET